jgi:hypothetical protein
MGIVSAVILWRRADNLPLVSKEEEQNILAAVEQNNPKGVIDIGGDTSIPVPDLNGNGPIMPLRPEQISAPNINVYNYRHTTVHKSPGPKSAYCGDTQAAEETSEFFEYFDAEHSFYKNLSSDGDKELLGVSIAKYGADINENYTYAGGKVGARLIFRPYVNFNNNYLLYPDSYGYSYTPASYPISYAGSENRISVNGYFGRDPQVVSIKYIDGRKYYEITGWEYSYCSTTKYYDPSTEVRYKVITLYTADAETFSVVKAQRYLESISESNLIDMQENTGERSKVSYAQVASKFDYDYSQSTINVDYRNFVFSADKTADDVSKYLKQNSLQLITPLKEQTDSLVNVYGKNFPERVTGERYAERRDYYPDTTKGETRYQNYVSMIAKVPLVSTSFLLRSGNTVDLETYTGETINSILDRTNAYSNPANISQSQTTLNLSGQNISVLKNLIKVGDQLVPISYPASYPDSYPYYVPAYSIDLIFEKGSQIYKISGYDSDTSRLEKSKYTLLNTAVNADYLQVKQMLLSYYQKVSTSGGDGYGGY